MFGFKMTVEARLFHAFIANNISTYHTLRPGLFLLLSDQAESILDVTRVIFFLTVLRCLLLAGAVETSLGLGSAGSLLPTPVSAGLLVTLQSNEQSVFYQKCCAYEPSVHVEGVMDSLIWSSVWRASSFQPPAPVCPSLLLF